MSNEPLSKDNLWAIRQNELISKLRLGVSQMRERVNNISAQEMTVSQIRSANELTRAAKYAATLIADSAWIQAMQDTGVSRQQILEIWDRKEYLNEISQTK